jgi:hypothetical protein
MMKSITLGFIGGIWDGRSLQTDSSDHEKAWLAAGCYEMFHHGKIGAECYGLTTETTTYVRNHHWPLSKVTGLGGHHHRYVVSERRETAHEVVLILMHARV